MNSTNSTNSRNSTNSDRGFLKGINPSTFLSTHQEWHAFINGFCEVLCPWPAIEIVFAGKESDTPYNHYDLFRTKFSNTYNFLALESFLMAPDGEDITYEYPDCHLPSGAQSYEANRIVAVEKFAGTTAYTRPLACHMVKGTYWSDTTFTEPKPFVELSSNYGLRLQTTAGYWWMERPDGVWRASRSASPPIVLTSAGDIVQLRQVIGHQKPGSLVIVLDNSRGQYANPGEGALASLRFRSEIQLRLGYKTPDGDLALESLTYWVDGWRYSTTQQTQSTLTLFCLDLWGLASAWSARYALRWNYTAVQPARVWEILYQLLGRFGIRLWNNPVAPKSDAIDDYYPKFISRGGTHADTQLRRLLSFVTDGLVPREAICFAKDLLSSEDSSYEYKNEPGAHRILEGVYGESTPTTHAQVSGDTEDEPPVRVREAAFDWELLALGIEKLIMQYDANLEEAEQAGKRADALLRHEFLESIGDHIVVPTNVGQELYDVITVTDARCGVDQEKYRVLAIQTDYDRRKGRYEQRLTIGAP